MRRLEDFAEIWCVDFEFCSRDGEIQKPICVVAKEIRTQKTHRVWLDGGSYNAPPFSITSDCLYVAYLASAELGCHYSLSWPLPTFVLDLFVEFKNLTNGMSLKRGLPDALNYFGLESVSVLEKTEMRALAIRGGPWSAEEKKALLEYCESDVQALTRLLPVMAGRISLPHALLRGRYMKAVAKMEFTGVPIDAEYLAVLKLNREELIRELVAEVDKDYGVFEGTTFKAGRFELWIKSRSISWPRTATGRISLDDNTFKAMALRHPEVSSLRDLRDSLSQLRSNRLEVGTDGRNRCLLRPFSSRTGRNQPSNSRFIFGQPAWLRSLIKSAEGNAIAYIDYSQQEFGIAAALSGDSKMIEAYNSGDPYLEFAKQAGAVPPDATKKSHPSEREMFKACILGVQYGMGEHSLALRLDIAVCEARDLLNKHRKTYLKFWEWSQAAVDYAEIFREIQTVYGWTLRLIGPPNPRSLRNYPMQSNGAEILRMACWMSIEAGVSVCAPIHDAILIESKMEVIDEKVEVAQLALSKASAEVLGGFELRSDAKKILYPNRFEDERGTAFLSKVNRVLERLGVRPCNK